MSRTTHSPWPDMAVARRFFAGLVAGQEIEKEALAATTAALDVPSLARWLAAEGLDSLAYARYKTAWPALAERLQERRYLAAAETELRRRQLTLLQSAFARKNLRPALLKGAALAASVYPSPAERTMSDIDLLLRDEEMGPAAQLMAELGYRPAQKDDRPLALQKLSNGEIQFGDAQGRLVELHWSPFAGWWLKRTTQIDEAGLWARLEAADEGFYQLAPEDSVIHLAVHLGINHHFSILAVRGLVDIAFTARERSVDWRIVAERAQAWRVGVVVYTALNLLNQLIPIAGMEAALRRLRPSPLRRALIGRFVSPAGVLSGRGLPPSWRRYLQQLFLVDRPRDLFYLVFRALWPEPAWLAARYGRPAGRLQHIWHLLRYREV